VLFSLGPTFDACWIYYDQPSNRLSLADNGGNWITPPLTAGQTGTHSNSQCTLDAGASTLTDARSMLRGARGVLVLAADAADSGVAVAEARLSLAVLRAPCPGLVTWAAEPGTVVFAGGPVARIMPDGPLLLDTYVDATQAKLVRFGAPRAPAALLSQALFWTDYFVASVFVTRGSVTAAELGVYSAAVRVGQVMVLFLTAVSYMFSPFVADLHARGERERLDKLFKLLTRWTMAGTIPLLALLLVVPGPLLRVFGGATFAGGEGQLRILLIGQAVNVSVGAVGFILIMVGRTGVDLGVYAASFLLDLVLAVVLVPRFGTEGAAIAQTATIALSNTLRVALVWRFVRIQPFDRAYARLLLPAAACGPPTAGPGSPGPGSSASAPGCPRAWCSRRSPRARTRPAGPRRSRAPS